MFNGSASGNAAADFLLGQFSSVEQVQASQSLYTQTLPAFFVQDDIRITRRLTLNLGVRYEPDSGYLAKDNILATFIPGIQSAVFPNAPLGLLYPGDAGLPRSIIGSRLNDFAPRAGLAWDVRGVSNIYGGAPFNGVSPFRGPTSQTPRP